MCASVLPSRPAVRQRSGNFAFGGSRGKLSLKGTFQGIRQFAPRPPLTALRRVDQGQRKGASKQRQAGQEDGGGTRHDERGKWAAAGSERQAGRHCGKRAVECLALFDSQRKGQ